MASILNSLVEFVLRTFCGSPKADEEQARPEVQQQQQQQWEPQPPPQVPVSHPPPSQHHKPEHHEHRPEKPHEPKHHNDYLANSNDPQYTSIRARARERYEQMGSCFERSRQAYSSGNGAEAKALSEEGHALQAEARALDAQAAQWIFEKNNAGRQAGAGADGQVREVDLHGLFVREAVEMTERAVKEAKRADEREIKLIVGKGLHSENHVAKIKPAIEELMQKENLAAEIDPSNSGVLIVYLDGQTRGTGAAMGADEISRQLEAKGDDKGCIVM